VGVLVRRKILDKDLAYDLFGVFVSTRWNWVKKAVIAHRAEVSTHREAILLRG